MKTNFKDKHQVGFRNNSGHHKALLKTSKWFKTLLFISIYFNLFQSVSIFSQTDSLNHYLEIAAQNNPGLKAKYSKYMADMQKVPQAGGLPDLDVSFGYFIKPMELLGGNQVAQFQVMQMFPWFGTLKASKDEASLMALSSFELFNAEKQQIFYDVRTNYYQLFQVQHHIDVFDTTLSLLKNIEQLLLVKLKTINTGNTDNKNEVPSNTQGNNPMSMNNGKQQSNQNANAGMSNVPMTGNSSVFSDLLRLQVEIREMEDNIATLKNRKIMLTVQMNTLMNRKKDTEIIIPGELKVPDYNYDDPTLFDSIKSNNPMIKMNQADIESYNQRQKMNRKMGYPMIGLGLNYSLINKNEMSTSEMNGKDMIMPMVNLKLPIYRKKYNASVKEAEYLENSATNQLSETENMLLMEFTEYQVALKDANRALLLYNDITDLTKKSFDILLVQYSSSGADFDAIIRLYRQLLDYRLKKIEAEVEKSSAIAGFQKLLSY